jgi:excisionase family DNA binding protein
LSQGRNGLIETDIMTIKELAAYLKMAEKTLYKLAEERVVPGFKVGGSWRFRLSEIEAWIKAQSNQVDSEASIPSETV